MVVIDLFSGAGGLTEGFIRERFQIIAHVEKDKWACQTLKTRLCYHFLKDNDDLDLYFQYIKNKKDYLHIEDDRELIYKRYPDLKYKLNFEVLNKTFGNPEKEEGVTSINEIIKLIEDSLRYNEKNNVDVIVGGPPCQAYSLIGRGRMGDSVKKDNRNYLFYYYKDIVNHFKPKVFVFENVPGILTAKKGKIFSNIQEEFQKIGYTLMSGTNDVHNKNFLDAKDFGVYQTRKRLILFACRSDINISYPNFLKYAFHFNELQNTRNAIGDLPYLNANAGDDFNLFDYDSEASSEYQKLLRMDSIGIVNHRSRANLQRDLKIYKLAIEKAYDGKQLKYFEIPKKLKTHKNEDNFEDRFKVHCWENIPHTIVAHMSKDGHYNIHPDINQCRSLTVREAARIQSFPDNFLFEGPRTHQYVQVGNAVPPLMAQAIAKAVKDELKKELNSGVNRELLSTVI